MKLAQLKRIPEVVSAARMRGTEAQDAARSVPRSPWQRYRPHFTLAGLARAVV